MRRIIQVGLMVALGTLLVNAFPDIKRYLKISRM
jgi:hypothetical protein